MKFIPLLLAAPLALPSAAQSQTRAMAQMPPQMLVSNVRPGTDMDSLIIDVTLLNASEQEKPFPERIAATLIAQGQGEGTPVTLERQSPFSTAAVKPGGFAQASYLLRTSGQHGAAGTFILSLRGDGAQGYAFAMPPSDGTAALAMADADQQAPAAVPHSLPAASAKPDDGNAFLDNISAYAPTYGVFGPGTDSVGRLQISFKYQLFGEAGAVGGDNPLMNGIHFAYTQRMFWDLAADSLPFRNIDFMPELFYLVPAMSTGPVAFGGQAGFRHESNGRDGDKSRSLNMLYIQPVVTMPVGDYKLSIGPRLLAYVGGRAGNTDIARYRGHTSLFAEFGRDDGLRLTTNSRLNFSTGKGAIDADVSYPLNRIFDTDLNVYLVGQAFAGYGENLLDYDRRVTRFRIGFAIVR